MTRSRFCLTAFALAALTISHAAIAQTPATPESKPATESAGSTLSKKVDQTVDQVEKWSQKKWIAARKEYAKHKEQWADCRKQAEDQSLKGKKSWSFLYKCMTTS